MVTLCVERMPMARAAPDDKSRATPGVNGPRSFTRTATLSPGAGVANEKAGTKGQGFMSRGHSARVEHFSRGGVMSPKFIAVPCGTYHLRVGGSGKGDDKQRK